MKSKQPVDTEEPCETFLDRDGLVVGLFMAAVAVAVFGVGLTIYDLLGSNDWPNLGVKGDFWGGHLGAFANFSAFIVIAATALLQRRELRLQRIELAESRAVNRKISEEAEKQAKALQEQLHLSRLEIKDSLFFKMLDKVSSAQLLVSNIEGGKTVTGRFFVRQLAKRVSERASDQDFFRDKFYELKQFLLLMQHLMEVVESEQEPRSKAAYRAVLLAEYPEDYRADIKTVIGFYDMPNYNLKTACGRLLEIIG